MWLNVNLVVAIRGVCAIVGEESRVKWKEGHLLGGAGEGHNYFVIKEHHKRCGQVITL